MNNYPHATIYQYDLSKNNGGVKNDLKWRQTDPTAAFCRKNGQNLQQIATASKLLHQSLLFFSIVFLQYMWRSPASFRILQQLEGVAATAQNAAVLQQTAKIHKNLVQKS